MKAVFFISVIFLSFLNSIANADMRSVFGSWIDDDGDCQDTRQEILIRDSDEYVLDVTGCKVLYGRWRLPYSGITIEDPSEIDIDHVVPIQTAIENGALLWTKDARRDFYNDQENLVASFYSENRSKGSRNPSEWMPPNFDYWCKYISTWKKIKEKYGFVISDNELVIINVVEKACNRREKYL